MRWAGHCAARSRRSTSAASVNLEGVREGAWGEKGGSEGGRNLLSGNGSENLHARLDVFTDTQIH